MSHQNNKKDLSVTRISGVQKRCEDNYNSLENEIQYVEEEIKAIKMYSFIVVGTGKRRLKNL